MDIYLYILKEVEGWREAERGKKDHLILVFLFYKDQMLLIGPGNHEQTMIEDI